MMDDLSAFQRHRKVTAARYALDWASRCRLIQRSLSQCLQVGGNKAAWAAAPTQSPRWPTQTALAAVLPQALQARAFRSCERNRHGHNFESVRDGSAAQAD